MSIKRPGFWGRVNPATVQERLLALLVVAVVPLCVLGGFLAWQNYLVLASAPERRVELIHQAASARYDAIIDDSARLLEGLARDSLLRDGTTEECDGMLERVFNLQHEAFGGLVVLDRQGRARCAATDSVRQRYATPVLEEPVWHRVQNAESLAIVLFAAGPFTGVPVLVTATKLTSPAAPGAAANDSVGTVLVASLRLEWLTQPRHAAVLETGAFVWFIDDANTIITVGPALQGGLPSPSDLQAVLGRKGPLIATASNGDAFAYEASMLPSGLRLLVGTNAEADVAMAQRKLGVRFAELGAFLLAGLAAVTFGANLTVVEPLKRLSVAVQRWRAGGAFDAAPPARAPAEIRELALSFSQATASLAEREKQLRVASTQQDLLMQEIHHRVKNNLQIIASLLNLQASRIRQPQAKAEFQSARDRIRALATLHRHLYAHNELHTINMRSFLNELCGQLIAAIGDRPGDQTPERIALQIDAPELQISSDQAVPIALIVTEAVSNAAKYAFPGGRRGHISVRLTTDEAARALLVIRDDGVGIPAGRAETETGVRDGIGIQLIRGFTRQLGASLTVTEENGTCYEIDIPLRRAREPDADPAEITTDGA